MIEIEDFFRTFLTKPFPPLEYFNDSLVVLSASAISVKDLSKDFLEITFNDGAHTKLTIQSLLK